MIIAQIMFGNIPEHLKYCVESVINYAKRNNVDYEQILTISDGYTIPNNLSDKQKYKYISEIADRIKLNLLSKDQYSLIIDWDIYLYSNFDFKFGDEPVFFDHPPESMIYNGSNTELFQEIKNAIPEKITPCKLMELIIRQEMNRGRNFNRFYSPGIKHWNNFQTL